MWGLPPEVDPSRPRLTVVFLAVHGLGTCQRRLPKSKDDRRRGRGLLLHLSHESVRASGLGEGDENLLLLLHARK